jgi:hypothetical protein
MNDRPLARRDHDDARLASLTDLMKRAVPYDAEHAASPDEPPFLLVASVILLSGGVIATTVLWAASQLLP